MVRRRGSVENEFEGVDDELSLVDKDKAKNLGALRLVVRRIADLDARCADLVRKQGALRNTLEEIKAEDIGAEIRAQISMRNEARKAVFAEWVGCYVHHALGSDDGSEGSNMGPPASLGSSTVVPLRVGLGCFYTNDQQPYG